MPTELVEIPISDSEPVKHRRQHFQNFGITGGRLTARRSRPNDFGVNLVELAISSLLWPFSPEHRSDAIKLVQPAIAKLVFDVGSDDTRGSLRPQRQ